MHEVVQFETSHGRKITVTKNHPLMTKRGWTKAGDITQDDFIASIKNIPETTSEVSLAIPDDEAKFIGYMLGDGHCVKHTNS